MAMSAKAVVKSSLSTLHMVSFFFLSMIILLKITLKGTNSTTKAFSKQILDKQFVIGDIRNDV